MNATPEVRPDGWVYCKLVGKSNRRVTRYSVVTEYLGMPFGPLAHASTGFPKCKTEGLTMEQALENGARVEKWMADQNGNKPKKALK